MKYIVLTGILFLSAFGFSQSNVNELFAAGIDDAEQFSDSYFGPVSEGAIYSLSNGWYNSADSKPLGGFEISIIGNMTSFKGKEDKKAFVLNTADYENLQFVDGSTSKSVSTALGDLEGIRVYVEGGEEFELPTGLASENINFIPSAFLQLSVGLIKGLEVKARFLPKIDTEDVAVGLYGVGLQYDFSKLLPADKILPVALSAVAGYTHLNASYDFTDSNIVDGSDQQIEVDMNVLTVQAVASTKLPVINFYGAIGYVSGKSTTDVLGTYRVQSGLLINTTYTDPFSLTRKANGVSGTLGAKLKLGFFRLHADYSLAEFNNLTVGVNFGFR
ncbi:hypothetical protein SAMN03080594_10443 [Arenibacter palladensis]|uniref:Outer membrane protein beta-barrel domain-containing protein n=1 Tax=Arenibacter palladensis TaxID=237373 RepID=A0A1M5BG07_9FLAO|nr:DUF6588 family protein [Arenibacter palladensis]SHF41396.1 hypothetical protein SAMN03080594_10443 [Arenibacter palladensis]